MSAQNNATLLGNLTRDPEMAQAGQYQVCRFGVAVNEKYGEKESVLFIDCEAWGKTGEMIAKYFKRGSKILISGELKLDRWESANGDKKSKIYLNVRSFSFPESKKSSGASPVKYSKVTEQDIPF